MCSRMSPTTCSSVSPRATYPHSHRITRAMPHLRRDVLAADHWQNLGVALAEVTPPAVRVQLCGPLVVDWGGARLDERLPGRQGRLLCAYLVHNRHRQVPRAELAAALWPQRMPGNVDSGLAALLSKLRQILGADSLHGRSSIRFVEPGVRVDYEDARAAVHRAESAVTAGDWARAWAPAQIGLFAASRGFLTGEDGEDEYDWIVDERRRVNELELRAFEAYGTACLGVGGAEYDGIVEERRRANELELRAFGAYGTACLGVGGTELAAAVRVGRLLVSAAPVRESGTRLLMRALAAEGNRAEALQIYEATRIVLRDQLGIPPSAPTQAIYTQLNH